MADREVSDLSYPSTASWLLYVHSASWDKLYILNLGLEKVFYFATKNLCEPCEEVTLLNFEMSTVQTKLMSL